MKTYLHTIATAVPEHVYTQEYASEKMQSWMPDPVTARVVRQIYRRSGIARRYSVLPDFQPGAVPQLFQPGPDGRPGEPTTHARNRVFIRAADELSVEVAQRALGQMPELSPDDITHVVTVSCTGFYNPGLDYRIVTALGLSDSVERYHLGFMGCYGAFPALRMAQQFCEARPGAVVLVVCLELCSLHLQIKPDTNSLLANAIFADGAAAAIVSARPPAADRPALALGRFHSALATEGKADMAWEIGDHGFNIVLSSYVPEIIEANVAGIVDRLVARESIDRWAVHPGGKAILDKLEHSLGLRPAQLGASRDVLRDYGNMSSATVLFVLAQLLGEVGEERERICAMAFGPGLTIETGLMETVPARQPALAPAESELVAV